MLGKDFFREEDGVVSLEYLIFAAAAGIILVAGVTVLFGAMSNYFSSWASFFGTGS